MKETLAEIILSTIQKEGQMTFERFMEMALYYPRLGYYTSERERIGPEGDFYTSPDLHPIFGRVMAGQLYEMWLLLGRPEYWQLVEYGAGKGSLARDILLALAKDHPESFKTLTYSIIEAGPYFIQNQQKMLEEAGMSREKVKWVHHPSSTHAGEGITGVFLSNELVDALPFHRVRHGADGLKEIYVDHQQHQWVELEDDPSDPYLSRYFEEEGVVLETGQAAEVNLRSRSWLQEISDNLSRGFVLTIDYGGRSEDLYSRKRFQGTMRCFRRHRLVESPYEAIGGQDITASVNFSSLMRWGEAFGLKPGPLLTQSEFLMNAGILELAGNHDDYTYDHDFYSTAEAVKKLVLPGGMGSVFKVLVQGKGLTAMPILKGTTKRFAARL